MPPSNHPIYIDGALRLDPGGQSRRDIIVPRCAGYLRRNTGWRYPQVFSPFWRLYYNFAPGQQIRADRVLSLHPGQFILIPENVLFHCETRFGAPPHIYIHFTLLSGQVSALTSPIAVRAAPAGIAIVNDLKREITNSQAPQAAHLSLSLLHWIFSRPDAPQSAVKQCTPALARVIEHIAQYPAADLSNPALARLAGMSLRAFVRSFSRHFDQAPHTLVLETRVREAARRLAGTSDSIDQIAEAAGFPSRFYLSRVFAKKLRVSPVKFRREMSASKN